MSSIIIVPSLFRTCQKLDNAIDQKLNAKYLGGPCRQRVDVSRYNTFFYICDWLEGVRVRRVVEQVCLIDQL